MALIPQVKSQSSLVVISDGRLEVIQSMKKKKKTPGSHGQPLSISHSRSSAHGQVKKKKSGAEATQE